nr:uncharacterized protein LOC121470649 isoform X2 [Taeniopygia guttata]
MEALGDAEGVAAGRTSPAPLLVTARKPSTHHRGPPTGKDKATGHKKPHETSENMRQMLKEMLQAGQEVDGEAVLKADFPRGSSGSLAASAAGRETMPGTVTGDEAAGKASPLDWLHKVVKPPAGVAAERIFPAPLLILTHKAGSHHRVPTRGKNKGTGKERPREPNNILNTIAMELQKGHGMDRDALWKAAFPKGREAMPRTVTGDAAGPTTAVPDSPKDIRIGFYQGTGWWLGLMAGMLLLVLVFILCCVLIWCYWKIKG